MHLASLIQAQPSRRWSCKYLPCWFQERPPNPFTRTLDRSASVSVYSPTLPPKLSPPNREPLHPTPYPIKPLLRKFPKPRRATFTLPPESEALLQWKQWNQIWNANQTTKSYHLTQVRMAIIKKSANNKCWRGYREKGPLLHCWWECKLIQLLWRTVWRFLLKTINRTTTGPSNPTLGNIPRDNNNWKKTHVPQYSLQHYLQWPEQESNLDIHWLKIDKEDTVHTYNGILLNYKNEWI